MIAVRPSRTSSPETRSSRFLIRPHSSPQWLTSEVSAERKPSSWVPPSGVLMVLAKVCTDSVNEMFHCIATSRLRSCVEPWAPALCSASNEITVGLASVLRLLRYSTKSTRPRS